MTAEQKLDAIAAIIDVLHLESSSPAEAIEGIKEILAFPETQPPSKVDVFVGAKGRIDSGMGGTFDVECVRLGVTSDQTPISYWKIKNPGWGTARYDYALGQEEVQRRIMPRE